MHCDNCGNKMKWKEIINDRITWYWECEHCGFRKVIIGEIDEGEKV